MKKELNFEKGMKILRSRDEKQIKKFFGLNSNDLLSVLEEVRARRTKTR